jgi:hypothetical protein
MKKILFISTLLIGCLSSVFAETINLEVSKSSIIETGIIITSEKKESKEDILTNIGKGLKESFYFHYDKKTYLELIKNEDNKKRKIFIAYLDNNDNYISFPNCENCIIITRYFEDKKNLDRD